VLTGYVCFRRLLDDRRGQGLVEYALILVLVAIVVIGVLGLLGGQIHNAFQDIVSTLQTGGGPGGN
jgi:pilus assembly protein Flp/PilA